jgi:hypothetical protein
MIFKTNTQQKQQKKLKNDLEFFNLNIKRSSLERRMHDKKNLITGLIPVIQSGMHIYTV